MASQSQPNAISSSSQSSQTSHNNPTVGGHYQVHKKIGEGSFGVVFAGEDLRSPNRRLVAVKFEPRKSDAPQLRDEYRSYRLLRGVEGIPQALYFGQEGLHNVLVIDLLGPNLEDLFDMCGRKFSIKTVCMLAKQMITRVQSVHNKYLIYRDIKPDNFLIGPPGSKNANTVYLIDFGMAKHYMDPKTHQHIPYRERKSLSGTARYMSINTHLGREQSRRDDMESLGHVFMYFLRGGLPWQGLKAATNKQKYEKIGEKKQTTPINELCEGFPEEFAIYMNYVRKLGFEEAPDYNFLRDLFSKVLKNIHEEDDSVFDWCLLNNGKGWEYGSKLQANIAAIHAGGREHRHREHTRRTSRPVDGAVTANGTGSPLILTPGAAQVKDRDRVRRHGGGGGGGGGGVREVSMSVQPIAPPSRQLNLGSARDPRELSINGTPTHPYASASASPIQTGNPSPVIPPYTRTQSNSPLPPIPGDAPLGGLPSGSNVALGNNQVLGVNGSISPSPAYGMAGGMMASAKGGEYGDREQMRSAMRDDRPRSKGFFAMLCCRP